MTRRVIAASLVVLAAAWPPLARAVEFAPQAAPPPLVQTPSGFIEVPGPHDWSPENFQAFPPPPSMRAPMQACATCPAAPAQVQPAPAAAPR
jgi:hypothetical protein